MVVPFETALRTYTPEEYLAMERESSVKHEYWNGEIVATAGAKRAHNVITGNFITRFNLALARKSCEVYPGDMRVRIPATRLYVYPDVVVVCGEPEFDDAYLDTLLNPTLVVEILSAFNRRR